SIRIWRGTGCLEARVKVRSPNLLCKGWSSFRPSIAGELRVGDRPRGACPAGSIVRGQATRKSTALPKAATRCCYAAAVQFHERTHQGETDAKPRSGTWRCCIGLHEQIEDVRQSFRCDTYTRVSDANEGVAAERMHPRCKLTARVRILRCVANQVHEHLLEPARVGLQPHGRIRPR